jgi:hypothetical protein
MSPPYKQSYRQITNKMLAPSRFDGNRVKHVYENYEGDHTTLVRERFETKVLSFFSQNLDFPAR